MLRNCSCSYHQFRKQKKRQKQKQKTSSEIVKLEMFLLYFKAKQQALSYLVIAKHLEI